MANSGPIRNVYWDSCVWIRLISKEPGWEHCQHIIEEAKAGRVVIWTSTLTLAEVYKVKTKNGNKELAGDKDADFENFLLQDFVQVVQVDRDIAIRSRRLCRKHQTLKKPNDGVHLATALTYNCDEFHTTDDKDLTPLSGLESTDDGRPLPVMYPPAPPPPAAPPPPEEFQLKPTPRGA